MRGYAGLCENMLEQNIAKIQIRGDLTEPKERLRNLDVRFWTFREN